MKKNIGFLLLLLCAIFLGLTAPFAPALDAFGHRALMLVIVTIGLWVFKPWNVPFSAAGGLMMASLLAIGVPPRVVFSGFVGGAVWTLIPALFFGFALAKTGLGKRIAYFGMKSIRVSYPSLLIMWAVIGIVLSLLTPSITVRVVIVTPIVLQCVQVCRLPAGSRERSLVLLTAWAMAVIPGFGWLTGSLNGPVMTGFYAAVPNMPSIDFGSWARVALLPAAVISGLTLIGGYFALKPAGTLTVDRDVFIEEYRKLGPITKNEIITAITLILSFSFFLTGSFHGIPDAAICLFAFFVFALTGVIQAQEISSGISWDLVLFMGSAMGLGSIFSETGISAWLSEILVDALAPIAGNPWLFIGTTLVFLFLWRFVDIAILIPTLAVVSAIAPEVSARYGIHPHIWIPLICIGINAFFVRYMNMFVLIAESGLGHEGWQAKHLLRYGLVYFAASLLAMIPVIPYWIARGYFG